MQMSQSSRRGWVCRDLPPNQSLELARSAAAPGFAGSHRTLRREGWRDAAFAFHDSEKIGREMLLPASVSTDS